MNKIISHLYMLSKKLTHHCFKYLPSICTSWIDFMDFLHFQPSKIRVSPTSIVFSLFSPWCYLSSDRCSHTTAPCHASFPLRQDELVDSASSSDNVSSHCLPSRAETEALNLQHRCRLPSRTTQLPPSTAIKRSSQSWSLSTSLNRISILPSP
jgi:hypothetical protein